MTDLNQQMKNVKRLKNHFDRTRIFCDAQYGIPTRCLCGDEIKHDVVLMGKYPSDFDTLPGKRYFTCQSYEDDGLHSRQPWAFGVEQEVEKLRSEVNEMATEIAKLKRLVNAPISGE